MDEWEALSCSCSLLVPLTSLTFRPFFAVSPVFSVTFDLFFGFFLCRKHKLGVVRQPRTAPQATDVSFCYTWPFWSSQLVVCFWQWNSFGAFWSHFHIDTTVNLAQAVTATAVTCQLFLQVYSAALAEGLLKELYWWIWCDSNHLQQSVLSISITWCTCNL